MTRTFADPVAVDDRLQVEKTPVKKVLNFAEDVLEGLSSEAKNLPSVYFYDRKGSEIFEEITKLPEYYLTRTEHDILRQNSPEIASYAEGDLTLAELGSGSSTKTRMLIEQLIRKQGRLCYHPIDISETMLTSSSEALLTDFPKLTVNAHAAEYNDGLEKLADADYDQKMLAILGSNIGNFEPEAGRELLSKVRESLNEEDLLLLGTDMRKDAQVLEAAYDDAQGVTARFNLNLLERINQELGGGFDVDKFRHRALYDTEQGRVEMRLQSLERHQVRIDALDQSFQFEEGEEIHTENSYKYSPQSIETLSRESGFEPVDFWTDQRDYFRVNLLRPA